MPGRMIRGIGLVGAAVLLEALAAAQQPPVFRSRVELITVDVSVLDERGRPIETLRAEDFQLLVEGQVRPLASVQYVKHATDRKTVAEQIPGADPSHMASNEKASSGRIILFAVDRQNIRRSEGAAALRAATEFVDHLEPSDRLAAADLTAAGALEFTTEHEQVKRRLAALTGRSDSVLPPKIGLVEALAISDGELARMDDVALRLCGERLGRMNRPDQWAQQGRGRNPCPVHIEQQSRAAAQYVRAQARQSIAGLHGLIARLTDLEGPKTVVVLSEGLVAEPRHVDFTRLAAVAQRARVSLYVLHAEPPMFEAADDSVSPTAREDFNLRADGLSRLAGATGGTVLPLIGTGERPFARMLEELSGYYLLAFEPTPADRDGRPRRIVVSVRVPKAVVRARAAFEAPAEGAGLSTTERRLVQLLRQRRLATELPVRLAVYRAQGATRGTMRAIVTAETAATADTVFGFVFVDERGVVATSAIRRAPAGRYSFEVELPAGRYVLRAAGIDTTGRSGSLEKELELRLPAGNDVSSSDLVLAQRVEGGASRPIVGQTLAAAIIASIEIYAEAGRLSDGVVFELEDARGRAVGRVRTTPRPVDDTRSIATAEIPLHTLPAGHYVVTATIDGQHPQTLRVTRPFERAAPR